MELKVISRPQKKAKPIAQDGWVKRVEKTQELFISHLPKDLTQYNHLDPLEIESVLFNKPLSALECSQVLNDLPIKPMKNMMLLDLGCHMWTQADMENLLLWISKSGEKISCLNLGKAQLTMGAWACLFHWLSAGNVQLECLDLGQAAMSLNKVKWLQDLCKNELVMLEKLDLGESVWGEEHIKVFLWNLFTGYNALTRISLSATKMPAAGIDLLMYYLQSPHCGIKVFSSGITNLGDTGLSRILDKALQKEGSLEACILSEQNFNQSNANKLACLIKQGSSLQHLAMLDCGWSQDVKPDLGGEEKASIKRIYIEAVQKKQDCDNLMHALESWGYKIARQCGAQSYWMTPRD
jgi:hypothetical protein